MCYTPLETGNIHETGLLNCHLQSILKQLTYTVPFKSISITNTTIAAITFEFNLLFHQFKLTRV